MPFVSSCASMLSVSAVVALGLAACDPDPGAADANPGNLADAPAAVDAPPPPDGPIGCDPDQVCFAYNAIDGVTDLPPGQLVIAWIPPEGSGDAPAQVAYDGAWTTAVTALDLAAIASPDAAHQTAFVPCGTPGHFAIALAFIGTNVDADGDGALTVDEFAAANVYGIFQGGIVFADVACAPTPENPAGILTGVHVYSDTQQLLDGVPTELQTCSPGTAACDELEDSL